jgi:hypothetical protein
MKKSEPERLFKVGKKLFFCWCGSSYDGFSKNQTCSSLKIQRTTQHCFQPTPNWSFDNVFCKSVIGGYNETFRHFFAKRKLTIAFTENNSMTST